VKYVIINIAIILKKTYTNICQTISLVTYSIDPKPIVLAIMSDNESEPEEEQEVEDNDDEDLQEEMSDYEFVLQTHIGFDQDAERLLVLNHTFQTLDQLLNVEEKDIRAMIEELGKRTVANGRVVFGIGRSQLMLGLMHWVQDCYRCSTNIDIVTINDGTLDKALQRAKARKSLKDNMDTQSKATTPGKFKKESEWHDWFQRFIIFLRVIPGMTGCPLSYVVREKEEPDYRRRYENFTDEVVGCAPLRGTAFEVDSMQVHTYLLGFIQGEPAEQWVKHLRKYSNGRKDVLALKAHYGGEGNTARRLADADRLKSQLHYKNEKAMTFEKFLDRAQEMFNIYEENDQPMYNDEKIRWLIQKIQNPQLDATIEALKTEKRRYQDLTYATASNDLATAVNELNNTNKFTHNISSTNTSYKPGNRSDTGGGRIGNGGRARGTRGGRFGGRGRGRGDGRSVTNTNTEGKLGYMSAEAWKKLTYEERAAIRDGRDKKGYKGGNKAPSTQTSTIGSIDTTSEARIISAISSAIIQATNSSGTSIPDTINTHAGNAFGGQNEAKRQKQN
jgi:hypothetical protein